MGQPNSSRSPVVNPSLVLIKNDFKLGRKNKKYNGMEGRCATIFQMAEFRWWNNIILNNFQISQDNK